MPERDNDFIDLLPPCVAVARDLADELHEAALRPFPDVSATPRSAPAARKLIDACVDWARGVADVRGGTGSRRRSEHDGPSSLADAFGISNAGATLVHAWDIFGEPPSFIKGASACWALICFGRGGSNDPRLTRTTLARRWPKVRNELNAAYFVAYMQAMQAAQWVVQRVQWMSEAAVPTISVSRSTKSATIHAGGVEHTASVSKSHIKILESLKTSGNARVNSNTVIGTKPRALLARLPWLRPFITCKPRSRRPGQNHATFVLSKVVQNRLSFDDDD